MKIRFFDHDDTREFNSVYKCFMPDLDGYELFDAPPAFAAYEDGKPVALATLLILPKNAAIPGSDDDSSLEAELTIFVHSKYRRRGLAKELARNIKKFMDENYPDVPVVFTLPDALLNSSFARYPAFCEMLLKITPDATDNITPRESIKERLCVEGLVISEEKQNKVLCICLSNTSSAKERQKGGSSEFYQRSDTENCLPHLSAPDDQDIAHVFICHDGDIACLYGLYVNRGYRGRGIGGMITEYSISYYLGDKIPVILNVRDTNTYAVNLYKKIGFTEADSCEYYKLSPRLKSP